MARQEMDTEEKDEMVEKSRNRSGLPAANPAGLHAGPSQSPERLGTDSQASCWPDSTEHASAWLSDFRVTLGELEGSHLSQATECLPDGGWRPRTGVSERKGETRSLRSSGVQSRRWIH